MYKNIYFYNTFQYKTYIEFNQFIHEIDLFKINIFLVGKCYFYELIEIS